MEIQMAYLLNPFFFCGFLCLETFASDFLESNGDTKLESLEIEISLPFVSLAFMRSIKDNKEKRGSPVTPPSPQNSKNKKAT